MQLRVSGIPVEQILSRYTSAEVTALAAWKISYS